MNINSRINNNPNIKERLNHYKKIIRTIESIPVNKMGYCLHYCGDYISYSYRELDNHLIIEKNKYALKIFELNEREKAQNFCYSNIIKFLMDNTYLGFDDRIYDNSIKLTKFKGVNIMNTDMNYFIKKMPWFQKLHKKEQIKINKRRIEKGLDILV